MLQVEDVPIDRLFPSPSNPRHNESAVPHVAASLRRFGWQQPIVARPTGEIIAGNTRFKAAQSLDYETVPVTWFDGDDLEATAYSIADNKTHEFAEWDEPALAELLNQLRAEDALEGVGYLSEEIDDLLLGLEQDVESDSVEDPGASEPPVNAVTQRDDLWILGDHRLLCGDSTLIADVDRVMAGRTAALVSTDPPYLVDYTGERPQESGKDWTAVYKEVEIKDPEGFFRSVFENAKHVMADHAAIYCWHAHKRQRLLSRIWEELGILDHQQIIWVKPTAVLGRVFWHFRHEPCLMGWVQGSMPEHNGDHTHDSVWEIDWEGKSRISGDHPTIKPVEIFARPIRKHTRPGNVCFEPFSGSGSQLIASQQTGRHCYAMEIEPAFVDVAIRRWQEATGQSAKHDESGQTFDEIARERGVA